MEDGFLYHPEGDSILKGVQLEIKWGIRLDNGPKLRHSKSAAQRMCNSKSNLEKFRQLKSKFIPAIQIIQQET